MTEFSQKVRLYLGYLYTLICCIVSFFASLLDPAVKDRRFSNLIIRIWAIGLTHITGMNVSVKGIEHLKDKKSYVLISNHQSFMDIVVLFTIYPSTLRMVVKKEILYIPIFGWILWWLRFIYIDRGNRRKSLRSIDKGAAQIKKDMSVLLFPEGTRSIDGALQPFRPGSFIMAIKSQVPIIPITVSGTINVMHKNDPFQLTLNRSVKVIISPPINTDNYGLKDRRQLKEEIEGIIRKNYETIRDLSYVNNMK